MLRHLLHHEHEHRTKEVTIQRSNRIALETETLTDSTRIRRAPLFTIAHITKDAAPNPHSLSEAGAPRGSAQPRHSK